jgi:hypothetical protein
LRKKTVIKRSIPLLLTVCILISLLVPLNVNADVINDSTSTAYVYNSDGEKVLTITMNKGNITIVGTSHAAASTSKIRWRTIGFTLTRVDITQKTTAKGKTGPASVNTAYSKGYAELLFDEAVSKESVTVGDTVTTTIKFDAAHVEKKLGDNFEDITKDTTIYLQGIFQTYNWDPVTQRETGPRKSKLVNWADIMNAEAWGPDTLNDYEKYYNVPIIFKPAMQKNTLYYYTESGTKIGSKALDDALPGDNVSWSNEATEKTYNGKKYTLVGYYVTKKKDKTATKIIQHNIDDGYALSKIKSGNTKVDLGGMNIVLEYRAVKAPTPTPKPNATPTPKPNATPIPTPIPVIVPTADRITENMNIPVAIGNIRADNRGSEKFVINLGVPTTESLYTDVISDQYLMGYDLEKKVGINSYPVKVSKTYNLQWTGKDKNGTKPMTSSTTVTEYVTIKRAFGYWTINNFDYFRISSATINNHALPDGTCTMTPSGYNTPSIVVNHNSSADNHIIIPDQIKNGIVLPAQTITGGTTKPSIPKENFLGIVDSMIPQLKVVNDYLSINGTVIMNSASTEYEGPDINKNYLSQIFSSAPNKCADTVLYKPGQVIEAKKKNGTYNSSGTVAYVRVQGINSRYNSLINTNILNLSSVVIHTPVVCNPIVEADNEEYVQLLNPSAATQLVLDQDQRLNDFKVTISNYGNHSYKQGYFTRDFSRSLRNPENVSYLAEKNGKLRNEVKFPFDVYIKEEDGDKFVKKDTWVVLGRSTGTFYLPMWVQEGIYTVSCRSIAVNANMDMLDKISEERVNSQLYNYVATNTFDVEVSGRLYGLSIYDITDYPTWQEAFRVEKSLELKINNSKYPDGTIKPSYSKGYSYDYTVGTNDQYGKDTNRRSKFTLPLVNGSHPFYKNEGILKTGYVVRFNLDTIGTLYGSGCKVRIKPRFYYVDAKGKNRTAVDIYYSETIDKKNRSLVKIGSALDKLNIKSMEAGSRYMGIPEEDLKNTASILKKKFTDLKYRSDSLFTFAEINMLSTFRTFINKSYTQRIVSSSEYGKIKETGITNGDMMKQMQRWYGCYYLPAIMHAVDPKDVPNGWTVYEYASKKGMTYHENFWKKDGYIIVNFDIVTVDSEGNERLSYINASNYLNSGHNSMWTTEGAPLSKTDNKGVTFNFKAGDTVIYHVAQSVNDDYSPGGLN